MTSEYCSLLLTYGIVLDNAVVLTTGEGQQSTMLDHIMYRPF